MTPVKAELFPGAYQVAMSVTTAQRTALEMHTEFGGDAANKAAERADKCMVKGDTKGFAYWNLVCAMIIHFDRLATSSVH